MIKTKTKLKRKITGKLKLKINQNENHTVSTEDMNILKFWPFLRRCRTIQIQNKWRGHAVQLPLYQQVMSRLIPLYGEKCFVCIVWSDRECEELSESTVLSWFWTRLLLRGDTETAVCSVWHRQQDASSVRWRFPGADWVYPGRSMVLFTFIYWKYWNFY